MTDDETQVSVNSSEDDSNEDGAADSLVAVLAVLIPVIAVIFWLSGLPVS